MAVTAKLYGSFFGALANEEHDLLDDVIKAMATTVTYVPDQDVHDYKNDITNEVTFTGYTAAGAALANDTFTYTAGSNLWTYDADNVVWTVTGSGTIRVVVVYNSTGGGTDATRGLICYQSSDADVTATDANLTVAWSGSGIFTITVG
jgi:hypothetical protein